MIQTLYRMMIELTNGRWTSSLLRAFALSKVSRYIVPSFVKTYKINIMEMEKPVQEYSSLHDLFVRRLKLGARPVDTDELSVVSPVDAVIEDIGIISISDSIYVKGQDYSITEMLGHKSKVDKYIGGKYMILYLSPSHYHRIHSPISGNVVGQWSLGGRSYPVNKYGLKYGKKPLSRNYRVITEVNHRLGHLAIAKVGAMFVNSIETIHKGESLQKGEEMAYFTFGSTVVLLFEKGTFEWMDHMTVPSPIKIGERVGYIRKKEKAL